MMIDQEILIDEFNQIMEESSTSDVNNNENRLTHITIEKWFKPFTI